MEQLHGVSVVFMNIHDLCGPASPNTGNVIHDHEVIEFKALGRHRVRRKMTLVKRRFSLSLQCMKFHYRGPNNSASALYTRASCSSFLSLAAIAPDISPL